jgi:NADH-quinone oxidoreductase subunit A
MDSQSLTTSTLWPLGLYFFAVLLLAAAILGLSYILGERHTGRANSQPYESGIRPTGTARLRFSVKYYLVAMFFVIFDLEAVFIFAWAAAFRESGWTGYFVMALFIFTLLAGLAYLWRNGALDWSAHKKSAPREQDR